MSNRAPEQSSLRQALTRTRNRLRDEGIEDAEIEAELLLRQALRGVDADLPSRTALYQRLEQPLDVPEMQHLESLVRRRLQHEPSAYITGEREFWGMSLSVSPDVLIPRPETELLVEQALAASRRVAASGRTHTGPQVIVDVGTGSGAIAIALARDLPGAVLQATDISYEALTVAGGNAARHDVANRIDFRHGDLLLPVNGYVDMIVANLPYVTPDEWGALEPELREHEPRLALDGGQDGLELIRALLHQAPRYLKPGGAVCLEYGAGQTEALSACVAHEMPGADVQVFEDFAGLPRVLLASH